MRLTSTTGLLAAALSSLIAAGTASASVTYNTQASFLAALNPGYYAETYQSFAEGGHATPFNFAGGAGNAFSYTATTSAQAFLCFSLGSNNRYLTTSGQPTTAWSAPITITFTGQPVNAIGGSFFLTSAGGSVVDSPLTLNFSDGTSQVINGGTNTTFWGYVSDTAITSLTLTPPATHRFVSVDNLTVGQSTVPTPGAASLVAVAGVVGLRRRRR